MAGEEQPKKSRGPLRLVLWTGAGIFVLVLAALAVAAGLVLLRPQVLEPLLVRAAAVAGYRAQFRELHVSLHPPSVVVRDLSLISREPSEAGGLKALIPAANIEFDPAGGWSRGVWIKRLAIEKPEIEFRASQGEGQGAGAGGGLSALNLFGELAVSDAALTVRLPQGDLLITGLEASLGRGGEEFWRIFQASASAAWGGESGADGAILSLGLRASGGISPGAEISAEVEIERGLARGPYAASFQGRARLAAKGRHLGIESLVMALENVQGQVPGLESARTGRLDLALSGEVEESGAILLRTVNATAVDPSVTLPDGKRIGVEALALHLAGLKVVPGPWRVDAPGFELTAPGLLSVHGRAGLTPDGLAVEASGKLLSLARALGAATAFLPPEARAYSVDGELPFEGRLAGSYEALEARVRLMPGNVEAAGAAFKARASGQAELEGPLAGPLKLSGDVQASGWFKEGDLALKGVSASADLGGSIETPELAKVRVDLPEGGLSFSGRAPRLGRISVSAQRAALDSGRVGLRGLSLGLERLGAFTGDLDLDPADLSRSRGKLAAKGLDLAELNAVLTETGLGGIDLSDLAGGLDLSASLEPSKGGNLAVNADFNGLGFSAARGDVYAGGLAGRAEVKAGLSTPRKIAAKVSLASGEALLDTYYLNFADYPSEIGADLTIAGPRDLRDVSARVSIRGIGRAELARASYLEGEGGAAYAGRVEIRDPDLPSAFKVFIKEPMSFTRPELAGLMLNGTAALDCDFKGLGRIVDVSGLLTLKGVDLAYPAMGVAAENLDLRLPFAQRIGAESPGPEASAVKDWGALSWNRLDLPTGTMRAGALSLALAANVLHTRGKQRIPLFGGALILGDARLDEPFSRERMRLETSAELEGLDLSALPTGGVPLEGRIAGRFTRIRADSGRLAITGGISGEFFGGELKAEGIGALRPFTSGRVLGVNELSVTGIDLEPLSKALDIGRVTGLLDVEIKGYRQAFGQPVALDLTARSREVSGVPRKISLKAVNSISVMGTGSGIGDVGVGLFAGFFQEFSYEAIGIHCGLANDVFRVRGLIREAGVEYLIKKPLLFGINVINRNPDNNISFSDMMDRVRRVTGGKKEN